MLRLTLLLLFGIESMVHGQVTGVTRVDVQFGSKTSLKQLGGPNVDLVVLGKNMGVIDLEIIDYEHEVVSAETNVNSVELNNFGNAATVRGTNRVVFSPTVSKKSIHLGNGFKYGSDERDACLVYSVEGGMKVFFLDALDVRQNGCALLVLPAPNRDAAASPVSVGDRLRRIEQMRSDGLMSFEEARNKRQEILSQL